MPKKDFSTRGPRNIISDNPRELGQFRIRNRWLRGAVIEVLVEYRNGAKAWEPCSEPVELAIRRRYP